MIFQIPSFLRLPLLLWIGIFLVACAKEEPPLAKKPLARVEGERIEFTDPKTIPGLLTLVQAQSLTERKARIPGRIAWDEERTVRVRSPFGGKVAEIHVQPGTKVNRGQSLATVLAPEFGAAQADLHRDEAEFARKRKNLERVRELYEHGVVPHKDLDEAEADYDEASSDLERAQGRLKLYGVVAGKGVNERFALKSPLSGVVVLKNINPGQEIQADANGAPLFVITDPLTLWVILDASESDLEGIDPGEAFVLTTKLPGQSFKGVVEHIADNVDPESRTVKIRGRVANPQQKLKADMFVTAEIDLPPLHHPLVPPKAVVMAGGESYVFVGESENVFIRRKVQAGLEERGMVPVLSGLKPGEKVVFEGAIYLQQLIQTARQKP